MDLDNDGYVDLLSGQYNPGIVSWFRGTAKGFEDATVLDEDEDPEAQPQWFSAPSFADLDGDGDYDFVVGGGGGIRINWNTGTANSPKFGKREPLLDVEGNQISVAIVGDSAKGSSKRPFKTTPDITDWDGDGVLDVLIADYWMQSTSPGLTFCKGVGDGRFEKGVPAFEGKWIPGAAPLVCVTDWNEDGKPDLLVGTSIVTVDGEYADEVNEGYEGDFGLMFGPGKDSMAQHSLGGGEAIFKGSDFRHFGYVYVRYGK